MRILLDMDEVLADFVGGAAMAWGVTKEDLYKHWAVGKWDMVPPLAKALADCGRGPNNMTQTEFWEIINGNEAFWVGLQILPWARELIDVVSGMTNDWHVASSPSHCVTSYSGKVKWLKRLLGATFDRFAITPHKQIFAGPDTVLVDDRDSNVQAFVRAGGMGVVFPTYHNSLHPSRHDPLPYVKEQLRCISSMKT